MSNNILTIRIKPFPGESLSSFIIRLANINGISYLSLWKLIRIERSHLVQTADINIIDFAPINVIDPILTSTITGLTPSDIFQMTFYYAINKFNGESDIERTRLMSGILRDTLHFCPMCLQEQAAYNLLWRVKDINFCQKHKVMLISKCPKCTKEIKYKDIQNLIECPYCKSNLSSLNNTIKAIDNLDETEIWYFNSWSLLISASKTRVKPSEVALRILYFLNGKKKLFNRDYVKIQINELGKLQTLLQLARNTLSIKRSLHITFLLSFLHENNIALDSFLNTNIPESFRQSILLPKAPIVEEAKCIAPWCTSYYQKGSLIKTGTSYKERNAGKKYHYYLACTKCGCEYAYDSTNTLIERTCFINGYKNLVLSKQPSISLRKLAEKIHLSIDQIRRCLAYFKGRGIKTTFTIESQHSINYSISQSLLKKFVKEITNGVRINTIKQWDAWRSYDEFLTYRYHPATMKALLEKSNPRPKLIDKSGQLREIERVITKLYEKDIDITISNIAKEVGACPETLRLWGCNEIIAKYKECQRVERLEQLKLDIYEKVDYYLDANGSHSVTSEEIYNMINTRRTVLWKTSPELTSYIATRLKQHNKELKKLV